MRCCPRTWTPRWRSGSRTVGTRNTRLSISRCSPPPARPCAWPAGRVLSLALSLGLLVLVYRCGRELGDAWAGVLAAALLALCVPFAYYAKMANLDVPYLFWFALSLLFFLRALRRAQPRDFALFA